MVLAVITFISSSVYFISSSHSSQSPRARPSLVKHPQKAVGNLEKFNKKIYETEKNNDNNEDENGDLNDDVKPKKKKQFYIFIYQIFCNSFSFYNFFVYLFLQKRIYWLIFK